MGIPPRLDNPHCGSQSPATSRWRDPAALMTRASVRAPRDHPEIASKLFPRQRMLIRSTQMSGAKCSRGIDLEPCLSRFAVRWQTEIAERLLDGVVPGTDLVDFARLLGRRDLASQLAADSDQLLDLLDAAHPLTFLRA